MNTKRTIVTLAASLTALTALLAFASPASAQIDSSDASETQSSCTHADHEAVVGAGIETMGDVSSVSAYCPRGIHWHAVWRQVRDCNGYWVWVDYGYWH